MWKRRLIQCGVVLSLSANGALASAQTVAPEPESEPPPSAPVQASPTGKVEAPVALEASIPPLAGKWDPAEVVLELTINERGEVIKATAVSGKEPFASVAVKAAADWEFKPANRDGEAVASKIHFLITFTPQAPEPVEEAEGPEGQETPAQEPTAPSSAASGHALEEVVVLGKIPDPAATSFSRAEVRNLPGAFDDPLRALESMPGVTPIATGLPLFFVRGAPPGNVGYFIDGIRVPLLYHAFLGPSVIHPAFIDKVSLSGGPMPAEYGRYAGGAVEAGLAEPSRSLRGEASVRLIDAGAFIEAPINEGRGYAMVGGRYSYTALLASAFSPGTKLDYWDYQALAGYNVTAKDELSVLTMGAFDYVGSNGDVIGGTEFHRVDLRWAHDFSRRARLRIAGTWGKDRTRSEAGFLSDRVTGGRLNFTHEGEDLVFRSGADVSVDKYNMDVDAAIAEPEIYWELFPPRTDVSGGAWMDFVVFPRSRVQLIPGVRADVFSSLGTQRFSVDPRFSAQIKLTPRLKAIHSIGIAHQSPNFVPNIPGAQVAGLDQGLQKSLQASTKYEAQLPWDLTGSVAFFINGTKDLTDPIGLGQSLAIDETSASARATGRAYGMEFFLKRTLTRNLGGIVSYTYSRTLRSFGAVTTVPGYDRPHVFNGAVTYQFGYNIRASAKLALASGIPGKRTTLLSGGSFLYDQSRSKPYMRIDAKISKRWIVSDTFDWGLHFEILNAAYQESVTTRNCDLDPCENRGTAPITFPSIGVDASWH